MLEEGLHQKEAGYAQWGAQAIGGGVLQTPWRSDMALPAPRARPLDPSTDTHIPSVPQGLPVFYAPGEAEAVCAALDRAGAVAGCASADGDCLLYGTETVLSALKLSVGGWAV